MNDIDQFIAELEKELGATPENLTADMDFGGDLGGNTESPCPTALDLDRWSITRGKDWTQSDVGLKTLAEQDHLLAADMLAAAWEPSPRVAERTEQPRRSEFLQAMFQTPEYQSLHRQTRMDDLASELAAGSFVKQWYELSDQEPPEDDLDREAQAMAAAKQACQDAKGDVDELNAMRQSLGGEGGGNGSMSVQEVKDLFKKVRGNHVLRRIMELSGRYLRFAQSLQRSKPIHGADDVMGIEFDNDLSRILPSELVLLDDEDLEYDFLRRYVERSLMSRELKSAESEQKGPLCVVVDESGSMCGDPVANAKAMALAILWVAEHQNRWACLVGFSGGTEGTYCVVPPGKRDTVALTEWLEHFYGGGTTMDVPLSELPKKWQELGCPQGRTDIIQITDACVNLPKQLETSFLAWKGANDVQLNTIVIGDDVGHLERVSDRWWSIDELNLESEGVRECLSV